MGNTLTGQIVAETYEALLKVTDNGIITGTKKRITDGFGNDTPLLLSSTDVQIDGNFLLPGTTLQYVRGDGSLATFPTIISTLTTTGSSGASTLIGSTLNIPNYTLTGLGGVPTSRTLTINGTTFDLSANRSWTITDTGLTSVGISMPSAFTVSNSPLTANGTIAITGAGLASQYVRGDGTLANFPTTGGGGSSVSYYFNGSVNQGTILGNVYRELNKTPIIGTGTDFTINANGYISQFITDANDPALLEIPGGNWNFEMYFSASSGGGSPSFYVELYKYNGTAFTLIASNSATPEGITGGTAIDLYTTALAVPQTVLTLTDRLAIRVYVTHSGRTITLHTENSHLCQVITTFSTGINALNSLTKQVQYLAVGTSGTDFAISSVTDTHTFNLPTASGTNRGALSSADWTTFNNKVGGSGTTNYVAKFTGTSSIGNSLIYDDATSVLINGTFNVGSNYKLQVTGNIYTSTGLSIGLSTLSPSLLGIGTEITGATTAYGVNFAGNINSGVTTNAMVYRSYPIVTGGSLGAITHYIASKNAFIGGSTVTNQYGFYADSSLFGATNNYGFYGSIGSATGAWNLYMAGNAPNYFNGAVVIGTTALNGYMLDVAGNLNLLNNAYHYIGGNKAFVGNGSTLLTLFSGTTALTIKNNADTSELVRITNAGNVGIGTTSPSSTLDVNGTGRFSGTLTVASGSAGNATTISNSGDFVSNWIGNSTVQLFSIRNNSTTGVFLNTQNSAPLRFGVSTGTTGGTIVNHFEIASSGTASFSGNVGIGTTSPATRLHLNGGTTGNGLFIQVNGSSNTFLGNVSSWTGTGTDVNTALISYNSLVIGTNDTERMRITSAGNVGIGNTSPSTKLDVNGDARFTLTNGGVLLRENGTAQVEANIRHNASRNGVISFTQDGYADWWAVGTKPYDGTLYFSAAFDLSNVKGTLTSAGVWSTTGGGTSDARTKKDIDYDFDNGIESILKLQPTKFKFKNAPDKQRRGFIAQDVLKIIPDLVLGDGELKDGTYGLDYDGILALAVKAIQEQQIQIEELKAKLK